MFWLRKNRSTADNGLQHSTLLDQSSFYRAFRDDLRKAKQEVIIECPFITARRIKILLPIFRSLSRRGVRVVINTKPLDEHAPEYAVQAVQAVAKLQALGVLVLFTDGHHRKLAIIDRQVLYEGSLNILSQNDSCEIMRRIQSEQLVQQMLNFIGIEQFIN